MCWRRLQPQLVPLPHHGRNSLELSVFCSFKEKGRGVCVTHIAGVSGDNLYRFFPTMCVQRL